MVESGYLGVAGEPHCVFLACNQPAILGFRCHDILNGGNTAEEVTQGFLKAWDEFGGLLDEYGSYKTVMRTHVKEVIPGMDTWSDGWTGSIMHAWNPDFVKQNYERQRDRWLVRRPDGLLAIDLPAETPHPDLTAGPLYGFGWLAMLASEVGDLETRDGLLAYADKYMSPQWTNGGYHYPRNDEEYDADHNLTVMNPAQSNALLPYARLNVPNGLQTIYSKPWGRSHFAEPALTEVDFSIDVMRAVYDGASRTLFFGAKLADGKKRGGILVGRVLGRGDWTLFRDGEAIACGNERGVRDGRDAAVLPEADGFRLTIDTTSPACYAIVWSK